MKKLIYLVTLIPTLAFADPTSTEAMGQKFKDTKPPNILRVLLAGSGTAHDFPKHFLGTDAVTLKAVGGMDVAATPNLEEALALLPQADVVVFSGNHPNYGKSEFPEFQKALHDFADAGKGMVMLHAATWSHPWEGYNDRFIAGRTPSHGKGEFEVTIKDAAHAVTHDLPAAFKIFDENYRTDILQKEKVHICAENAADKTEGAIPSVWIVKDPKTRIVCITLGHDERAHENPAFKTLLINAVKWVGTE